MVNRLIKWWLNSGGLLTMYAAFYLLAYLIMQYSGLFRPSPNSIMQVLHQWPALAGIFLLMAGGVVYLVMLLRTSQEGRQGSLKHSVFEALFFAGIIIWCLGVLLSSLTRFEGSVTLTEGQDSSIARDSLDPDSLYINRFSRAPSGKLALANIDPVFSDGMKKLKSVTAYAFLINDNNLAARELKLKSSIPNMVSGYFYGINDIGYSVLYRLYDTRGIVSDEAYTVLKLFPFGAEDSFRMIQLPHTFYLRYYPDALMVHDQNAIPKGKNGPLLRVRIARNIELVANTFVEPGELVPFDSVSISFGAIKKWVQISIVWDPGLYLIVPGIIVMAAGGGIFALRRIVSIRSRRIQEAGNA